MKFVKGKQERCQIAASIVALDSIDVLVILAECIICFIGRQIITPREVCREVGS
jgi:hypothetical protein